MNAAILRMFGYRESDVEIEIGIEVAIDIADKVIRDCWRRLVVGVLWACVSPRRGVWGRMSG